MQRKEIVWALALCQVHISSHLVIIATLQGNKYILHKKQNLSELTETFSGHRAWCKQTCRKTMLSQFTVVIPEFQKLCYSFTLNPALCSSSHCQSGATTFSIGTAENPQHLLLSYVFKPEVIAYITSWSLWNLQLSLFFHIVLISTDSSFPSPPPPPSELRPCALWSLLVWHSSHWLHPLY